MTMTRPLFLLLCSPALDEALAACERLGKYMVDITTANKLISKCSRIRAMHDNAQNKRDLDTIDRFLDGQR